MDISFDEGSSIYVETDVSLNVEGTEEMSPFINDCNNNIATSTPKKVHTCEQCTYRTYYRVNMRKHVNSVHKHVRFTCGQCNRSFASKYYLMQHLRSIHKNEQFICELCSKAFNSRQCLNRHKRVTHLGVRKLDCRYCDKTFYETNHFYGHINKHMGMKPFSCSHCRKSFFYRGNMKRHEAVCRSVDKSKFNCQTCGKSFKTAASFNDHMTGKHGDRTKICACGKTYAWRSSFNRHIKKCKFLKK